MKEYLNARCIVDDDGVFYYDSVNDITSGDVRWLIYKNEVLSENYEK